ncbi:hypothetical protein OS125_03865 [Corynebacterium sp. P7003]|uniref:Phage major capsid protein n=1 Tax=Corynebacterium pygosceleis TaxID=2800406 RepID=A0ABT3WQI4_9CORY|nr:major capsid protein [Corynebacterium pygosceleis]MCX7444381.1 hypothetical protein [Corynebacterium pygosceleis]
MPLYPGNIDLAGNGSITVDQALNHPTVITERINELVGPELLADTVFSSIGAPVTGGAVIYSPVTEKHLFTTNDVEDRNPGDEYPHVYFDRPGQELARVQDFGGKFDVTDEARRRNQSIDFDVQVTALANTILRKLDTRVIETLEAGLKALDDNGEVAANDWSALVFDGPTEGLTPTGKRPTADFAVAQLAADLDGLNTTYSMLILNPRQRANLVAAYGPDLSRVLESAGLTMRTSLAVASGTGYLVDPGQVGFIDYEQNLTTETWDDREHRKTWVQSYCMPVMGVTSPRAIRKLTGLAG